MKYLSDYMQENQTNLFNKYGVFFAFSDAQFKKGKDKVKHLLNEGDKLTNFGSGMFAPSKYVNEVIQGLEDIYQNAKAQDLKDNGKTKIIKRELANHECYYTGDWMQCYNVVSDYGITKEEVKAVYLKQRQYVEM